jgi:hypothetical protein
LKVDWNKSLTALSQAQQNKQKTLPNDRAIAILFYEIIYLGGC